MNNFPINIITGLSGSGKSVALASFEDAGFYCIDNLPVTLLPKFLEIPLGQNPDIAGFAIGMDLREPDFISKYPEVFNSLQKKGYNLKIYFMEASEEVLVRRYSETRRLHPLAQNKSLLNGIRAEKAQLEGLRKISDKIIDTSNYNAHTLKALIVKIANETSRKTIMRINILSFGFKHGIPGDADLIIDVRFIANPYFVQELKDLDGENENVSDYVLKNEETQIFLKKCMDLLDYLLPLYEKEGKSYLTIAFGCTGGRHRSVAIARKVYAHIGERKKHVEITHRDISR